MRASFCKVFVRARSSLNMCKTATSPFPAATRVLRLNDGALNGRTHRVIRNSSIYPSNRALTLTQVTAEHRRGANPYTNSGNIQSDGQGASKSAIEHDPIAILQGQLAQQGFQRSDSGSRWAAGWMRMCGWRWIAWTQRWTG